MTDQVKIIGIVGSVSKDSSTRKAMKIVLDEAAKRGALTELVDLREYDLPIAVRYSNDEMPEHHRQALEKFKSKFDGAVGIILGSPEYHGSMTGVLKNAIDNLGFDQFQGKIVGLLGTAGGEMGATNTLNHLRLVGRNLHSWVLPKQVSIGKASSKFDDNGTCLDERIEKRLRELGCEVAKFSYLHHSKEISKFVDMWLGSQENPGGD